MNDSVITCLAITFFLAIPFIVSAIFKWQEDQDQKRDLLWKIQKVLANLYDSSDFYKLDKISRTLDKKSSLKDLQTFYDSLKVYSLLHEWGKEQERRARREQAKAQSTPTKSTIRIADLLGLRNGFTKDELKKAYRSWMFKNHPDKNPNANLERVQKVTEWYNRNK